MISAWPSTPSACNPEPSSVQRSTNGIIVPATPKIMSLN
jgi:hypothetical protein